jgi:glutaredoxin 3
MQTVEIYTTSTCPFCVAAKRLLNGKNIEFTEIDVASDPDLRAKMTQRALGQRTVPQIFVGSTHVGGCDDLYALESDGKLDALVAG